MRIFHLGIAIFSQRVLKIGFRLGKIWFETKGFPIFRDGFGHLLPRGLLREPLCSLRRADAVVVTRADQVSAADPLAFASVALAMFAVGVLASALPAWRAIRVDPAVALRTE